mmetsp:Transcript_58270/g.165429  ORF Transcript_58270/g.165429 Transcript_58270/m.165429 type:complete len:247 (+) Transcript_58270:532-1272(+)
MQCKSDVSGVFSVSQEQILQKPKVCSVHAVLGPGPDGHREPAPRCHVHEVIGSCRDICLAHSAVVHRHVVFDARQHLVKELMARGGRKHQILIRCVRLCVATVAALLHGPLLSPEALDVDDHGQIFPGGRGHGSAEGSVQAREGGRVQISIHTSVQIQNRIARQVSARYRCLPADWYPLVEVMELGQLLSEHLSFILIVPKSPLPGGMLLSPHLRQGSPLRRPLRSVPCSELLVDDTGEVGRGLRK